MSVSTVSGFGTLPSIPSGKLMSSMLVRVLWQSHPYGWLLRWFDEHGRYAAELVSSAPPYRHLCSGSLNADDTPSAWQRVQALLASVATEPTDPHSTPHSGFVIPVAAGDVEPQSIVPYYYYSRNDKRESTRHYVNLVLIIDKYMKSHYADLLSRDDLWQ